MILQSDLLALQVVKELNLDRRPDFGGKTPALPSTLDLAPDPLQADSARTSALIGGFRGNLKVSLSPNTHIIKVSFRSPDKELTANVVNTLMNTYTENNFKSRFDSTMQASDWLSKQLVDLQMKVETSQEKLVRYQKEHEILGIDEKQNIITSKLDELNKALTAAESDRMAKESVYRLVQAGDADSIVSAISATNALDASGATSQTPSNLLEALRTKEADLKIRARLSEAGANQQPTEGNRHPVAGGNKKSRGQNPRPVYGSVAAGKHAARRAGKTEAGSQQTERERDPVQHPQARS
jgi:uncharacterized protein involved in exopolysaccharide biosynthesis